MTLLPIFLLCLQAYFIQASYSQCTSLAPTLGLGYSSGFYGNLGFSNFLSYGNCGYGFGFTNVESAWTSSLTPFIQGPMTSSYGGVGNGVIRITGELPVAGTTIVTGQVPIIGTVQFSGNMPASGTVIITGSCGCGCGRSCNCGCGCGCSCGCGYGCGRGRSRSCGCKGYLY